MFLLDQSVHLVHKTVEHAPLRLLSALAVELAIFFIIIHAFWPAHSGNFKIVILSVKHVYLPVNIAFQQLLVSPA
jgi:hypothetical protein